MRPHILIAILHAAFDERRRELAARLLAQLRAEAPGLPFFVYRDMKKRGCTAAFLRLAALADARAEAEGHTHVCVLQDDAMLCRGFGRALERLVAARPKAILDLANNHPGVSVGPGLYSTFDGFVFQGGTMPVDLFREYLSWRVRCLASPLDVAPDLGVNLWAMATSRLIDKPRISLVDHDDGGCSLLDASAGPRRARHFADAVGAGVLDDAEVVASWERQPAFAGRTYRGNHRALLGALRPELVDERLIERIYEVERNGAPLSTEPSLMVARLSAGPTSREALVDEGYIVHRFLASPSRLLKIAPASDARPLDAIAAHPDVPERRREDVVAECARLAQLGPVPRLGIPVGGDPEAEGAPLWHAELFEKRDHVR